MLRWITTSKSKLPEITSLQESHQPTLLSQQKKNKKKKKLKKENYKQNLMD